MSTERKLEVDPKIENPAQYLSWAAIDFIRAPSSRMLFAAMVTTIAITLICVMLSFYIELDVSVDGPAVITSDSGIREIHSTIDGLVTEVKVKVGDHVGAEQVLGSFALDGFSLKDGQTLTNELEAILKKTAESKELQKLILPNLSFSASKIYDQTLLKALGDAEQSVRNYNDQKDQIATGLKKELHHIEERIDKLKTKIDKMKASKQRKLLLYYIDQSEDDLSKLNGQKSALNNQTSMRLEQSLSEVVRTARLARGTLESFKLNHQIRTPIKGVIAKIDVNPHTRVNTNTLLITVIPADAKFVAKIKIRSKDVVKVHGGQKVHYKVEAYPYQKFGVFEGEVEAFDRVQPNGTVGFTVKASITPPIDLPAEIRNQLTFVVDMEAEAKIVTERKKISRLVYEKLFQGLMKH